MNRSIASVETLIGVGREWRNFLTCSVNFLLNSFSVDSFDTGPIIAPISNGVGISISPESKEAYPERIAFCNSVVSKYSALSDIILSVPDCILFIATSGSQSTHMHRSGISAAELIWATLSTPNEPTIPW